MAALLHRLHRTLHQIEDGLIVAVLLFMVLLAVAQIVLRNFFGTSLVWIEPLLQNAVLWIGLLGAMIASRNDEHIRIDVASSLLPEKYHPFLTTFVDLFTAFICVLVAWYSVGFVIEEYDYAGAVQLLRVSVSVVKWLIEGSSTWSSRKKGSVKRRSKKVL